MIVYKATRPDGTDFHTGEVKYGKRVKHPTSKKMVAWDASTYLSFSKVPTDCTGFSWPCRLFKYETVGKTMEGDSRYPNKVACLSAKLIEELPAWQAFGPQGEAVVALIEKAKAVTPGQARRLYAAWDAAWDAARTAVWDAAWNAARDAVWDAARTAVCYAARTAVCYAVRDTARDAALALVVKDLITEEQFNILYGPWMSVMENGEGGER